MSHWFDIGVNLPDQRLPLPDVVHSALEQDVTHMLLTGTHVKSSTDAAQICADFPERLYSTAGVHPHNAKDVDDQTFTQLAQLLEKPYVLAVGECGLDFNRNFSPKADQLRVFEQQLELAVALQLPVFLHERDAFPEQLTLLQKYRSKLPGGVAHCFTGSLSQMQAYLELDLYIGITGWLCDPKRGLALQEAVKQLPLDKLLLETDSPYLFPKTLKAKNKTNQPANLPFIAQALADLIDVPLDKIKSASWQNTCQLLNLQALLHDTEDSPCH